MNRQQRGKQTDNFVANKILNSIRDDARQEGMIMAASVIFIALRDKYGFASNSQGNGRLDKLIDILSEEFEKMDQDSTKFCFDYYVKKLEEQTGLKIGK